MAVTANTALTYNNKVIREDLKEMYALLTPDKTVFQNLVGKGKSEAVLHEWHEVDLAAVDKANRVLEGEANPATDAPTLSVRKGNYCQLSDKVATVSSTSNASNSAGDTGKMAKQIVFKTKELKRDIESMLLDNVAANAGGAGVARASAGLPAFLTTNVSRGATGANPTTSGGAGGAGYPNAAATDGTLRALTEAMLKGVLQSCWQNGAEPRTIMCGGLVKQKISTLTGNGMVRNGVADEETLYTAIEVYVSDFGTLQVLPNRFQRARDVFILDPDYLSVDWLQTVKNEELAKTGHASSRLISGEYTLMVESEKANGIIADIDGAL
ncbi:SU10 major capsid protein [Paracoccus sulfuroxidans]|uniref:Head protein n=1 Tax=Paracoccus sulfuroxidans TaxID=384678 RepID=A0A562NKN7_9RHOB|nr:DUF5309 family protein [Paracoccus sulfuroxidans]TWI32734.1 hypothetical protein IQ24_02609 [Paracoccus sulfuroxidans]